MGSFCGGGFSPEKPLSVLCSEFGISRPTGSLWTKRYAEAGLAGIAERSRRPLNSPAQTDWEREEKVIALRLRYPDWGARKLALVLQREGLKLTRSTVHRILLRYDLVREQDRHTPALQRFERERSNELWQMDFKGPKNWPQTIGPLSVIDDHSRYLVTLDTVGRTDGHLVREQLERAFERCGVPEAMLMDHGTPWWDWQSFSGRTPSVLMDDAPRHTALLVRRRPPADTREGRALPRQPAAGAGPARRTGCRPAGLAGQLPRRVQPETSP